jgi:hypothetical protein
LEVRAIADPSAAIRGGDDLAVARGQLRLGNVGLALEAFRKIQRDRPSDAAALAGIGDCYSAMGRLDVARFNYEAALALAPKSPLLLNGLAQVLEREGLHARAIAVRVEAAVAAMPVVLAPAAVQPVATAHGAEPVRASAAMEPMQTGSITVSLPPVRPAQRLHANSAGLRQHLPDVEAAAQSSSVTAEPMQTGSITVSLPPVRPAPRLHADSAGLRQHLPDVDAAPPSSSVTLALPSVAPAPAVRRAVVRQAAAGPHGGPRLERLSPGEVALVTSGRPLWLAQPRARIASASVRWLPLAPSGPRPNVQVLNAARSEGLAASARAVLFDRGWRRIAIGNADHVQRESVVLYPKERAALARSLAAQFGIGTRLVEGGQLILVLGRDKEEAIKGQRG